MTKSKKRLKKCLLCGDHYVSPKKANKKQRYCGSWRKKRGCSWIMATYGIRQMKTTRATREFLEFARDRIKNIEGEYLEHIKRRFL